MSNWGCYHYVTTLFVGCRKLALQGHSLKNWKVNVTTVEVNVITKDRHYLVVKVNVSDVHYYIVVKVNTFDFIFLYSYWCGDHNWVVVISLVTVTTNKWCSLHGSE